MKKHLNIPIFIPHLACPNDCVFCNQKKIAATEKAPTPDEVNTIISEAIKTLSLNGEQCEIAFFGGSFTGIDKDLMKKYLQVASNFGDRVSGIRFSTRPDYISPEIMDILSNYPIKTIELGMQSMDDSVLSMCSRGHNSSATANAVKLIKDAGYELILQMMTGLPGDTAEGCINTAKKAISLQPDGVRIYPCIVVKDTELEQMYYNGSYQPMTLADSVDLCSKLLLLFEENNIPVIRLGLFSEQSFTDNAIVTGPYHPSFRELCENKIYRDIISEYIVKNNITGNIEIFIPKGSLSMVIGHQRSNIKYFTERFNIDSIKFKEDENLHGRNFIIKAD